MIVVDASAMVEALVGVSVEEKLVAALSDDLAAPELLDVEVLGALAEKQHRADVHVYGLFS